MYYSTLIINNLQYICFKFFVFTKPFLRFARPPILLKGNSTELKKRQKFEQYYHLQKTIINQKLTNINYEKEKN